MNDNQSIPPSGDHNTESHSAADWREWRDLLKEAVTAGKQAGANAGESSANKLHQVLEKAVYDLSYGVAFGAAYGMTLARDAVVRQAKSGVDHGVRAGESAARKAETPVDFEAEVSPSGA